MNLGVFIFTHKQHTNFARLNGKTELIVLCCTFINISSNLRHKIFFPNDKYVLLLDVFFLIAKTFSSFTFYHYLSRYERYELEIESFSLI